MINMDLIRSPSNWVVVSASVALGVALYAVVRGYAHS